MINRQKQEIDKIYQKIDKIAKKGQEYYQEYADLIDEHIMKGKYSDFKECLNLIYEYDANNIDVSTVKKESWSQIRFLTNSSLQEQRQKLLKSKGVYQLALDYYREVPLTKAKMVDTNGIDCELLPVIENGGVNSITILKQGRGYSNSATISITGGLVPAFATPVINAGRVTSALITATGSGHNQVFKLGRITEIDEYQEDITNKLTKDQYQRLIKNKKTILVATKEAEVQSTTFSAWNLEFTYDKNLLKLYTQAVNYLLS